MAKRSYIAGVMKWARRLMHNRRGATVVEFALVGPLFIIVMCGILENGLILLTQTMLDNATRDAARLIMLGTPTSLQQFKDTVCKTACTLIPENELAVNVVSGATFGALNATLQTDADGKVINSQYNTVGANKAVIVQVAYNRPFMLPIFGAFSGVKSELLVSTVAFKTEPFQ